MRVFTTFCMSALVTSLIACSHTTQAEEFGGKIAKSYKDSVEWWAEPVRPPEGTIECEAVTLIECLERFKGTREPFFVVQTSAP